jgi:chemotaxis protein MotB
MSKKKHSEHVNHERWLVSYADFITLLFAFFVVLFASGQTSKRKQVQLAHSMQAAFDNNGFFEPHSKTPPIAEDANATERAVPSPLALPMPSLAQPDAPGRVNISEDRIKQVVEKQIEQRQLGKGTINVHRTAEGLVVSLREAGFFASGSSDVRNESMDVLQAVAHALPRQAMRVEGHTDNVPIHTEQFATNWELSTARAASITRLLIAGGAADPASIAAAGYAEFHPIADNATEAGRMQNRRVDIVLLNDTSPAPSVKAQDFAAHAASPPAQAPSR